MSTNTTPLTRVLSDTQIHGPPSPAPFPRQHMWDWCQSRPDLLAAAKDLHNRAYILTANASTDATDYPLITCTIEWDDRLGLALVVYTWTCRRRTDQSRVIIESFRGLFPLMDRQTLKPTTMALALPYMHAKFADLTLAALRFIRMPDTASSASSLLLISIYYPSPNPEAALQPKWLDLSTHIGARLVPVASGRDWWLANLKAIARMGRVVANGAEPLRYDPAGVPDYYRPQPLLFPQIPVITSPSGTQTEVPEESCSPISPAGSDSSDTTSSPVIERNKPLPFPRTPPIMVPASCGTLECPLVRPLGSYHYFKTSAEAIEHARQVHAESNKPRMDSVDE